MTLVERIDAAAKDAMRARDATRLGVLRMLKSLLQNRAVELRTGGVGRPLDDDEATAVVATYAKQRRDSIESYRAGGREDLAAREEAELAIVQEFLPAQADEERIRAVVREAIAESGASSPRDLGAVMKLAMPRLQGAADGKVVNRIARELLQ